MILMTVNDEIQNKEELCEVSGIPKDECVCSECCPIVIDIYSPLLEARNVNELSEKLSDIRAIVEYLQGYVFCKGYSIACPHGEMGDFHRSDIQDIISRETFEIARSMGWSIPRKVL
jgi:hypothetical protein